MYTHTHTHTTLQLFSQPFFVNLCIKATENIIKSIYKTFDTVLENEKQSKPRRDIQTEEESKQAGWNM